MLDVDAELEKMEALFVKRADGYINAGVLCRAFSKGWRDYVLFDHASYPFHDYLGALQSELWIADPEDFVQVEDDQLWVHPKVGMSLAQWLSIPFAVAVSCKFAEVIKPTQAQLIEWMKPEPRH